MLRTRLGWSWKHKAVALSLSATLSGVAAGAALGAAGEAVGSSVRAIAVPAIGCVALMLTAADVLGRPIMPPQRNVETPYRLFQAGGMTWAVATGAILGLGATTRIEFWLWYLVPLGAFLSGDPLAGLLIYGTYALLRTAAAPAIVVAARETGLDVFGRILMRQLPFARASARLELALAGVALVLMSWI